MQEKWQFKDILSQLLAKEHLTPTAFARKVALSHAAVQNFLSGASMPRSDNLAEMAKFFDVPMEYILTGKHYLSEKPPGAESVPDERVPRENSGPYYGMSGGRCPIISWASAGNAHAYEDQGQDVPHILTRCKDQNCYALAIEGDSMSPAYLTGDIAVVSPNREAQNGRLVIAKTVDDDVFFKQLKPGRKEDTIRLLSFNPNYAPLDLHRSELRFIHPVYSVTRYFEEKP